MIIAALLLSTSVVSSDAQPAHLKPAAIAAIAASCAQRRTPPPRNRRLTPPAERAQTVAERVRRLERVTPQFPVYRDTSCVPLRDQPCNAYYPKF
ncbi:hypothetical protein B0H15DRAFT_954448 [Mycena belliarum]|uniref:Uncharacterized protein n=1 Tax=Mycena belliarum TaxID=1033014 RepID=A0AAD6TTA2_9AGAR|nr:hypothetical protein B0H15DRAFT_954448 [Mycena belliae]